jgi:hypothetical protein
MTTAAGCVWIASMAMGCAPVTVTKTYTEHYWDPHTGKEITYTESITQIPEQRMPVHLKQAELYE